MKSKINDNYDLQEIGNRIGKLISHSKYNNTETAKELKITVQALSNIVNGKALPATKTLLKMSKLFEVTIDFILTGKELEDLTLHKYKAIAEEVTQKIKDLELPYSIGEVNKLIQDMEMKPENKKKYLLMMKIIYILIFNPNNQQDFESNWQQLPGETQDLLLSLDKKIMNNLLKRKSEGEEKE